MSATPRVRSVSASANHRSGRLPPSGSTSSTRIGPIQEHLQEDNSPTYTGDHHAGCLCSTCHLKAQYFPRRPDGRIVLPQIPTSTRPATDLGSASNPTGLESRRGVPRRAVSYHVPIQTDKGEEASIGSSRLLGPGVPSSPPRSRIHLPPISHEFDRSDSSDGHNASMSRHRSSTVSKSDHSAGFTKQTRKKPYDVLTKRQDSRPKISATLGGTSRSTSLSVSNTSIGLTNASQEISELNTISVASGRLREGRRVLNLYESQVGEQRVSPTLDTPIGIEHSSQVLERSKNAQTLSSSDARHASELTEMHPVMADNTMHPARGHRFLGRNFSQPARYSDFPMTSSPDRVAVAQLISPRESTRISVNRTPVGPSPSDVSLNSHYNPRANTWRNLASVQDNATVMNSSHMDYQPMGATVLAQPQASVSQEIQEIPGQTQFGVFKFQDPLMPESEHSAQLPSSSTNKAAIVQVKWDSERKRRQGYFSQDEGDTKSPFRHYNKAGCDA